MKIDQKILFLLTIVVTATSYTHHNNVFLLEDDDFPGILQSNEHMFISFSIPMVDQQKQYVQLYQQIGTALRIQKINAKFGKVDISKSEKVRDLYRVAGIPTMLYFHNGRPVRYDGEETKSAILGWLQKRVRSPVIQIDSKKYKKLQSELPTSIVYHGDFPSSKYLSKLNQIALQDEESNYYWGENLGEQEGTLQILRRATPPVKYSGPVDQDVKEWIEKYRLGLTTQFNRETMLDIFKKEKKGLVFFDNKQYHNGFKYFEEAARRYKKADILFGVARPNQQQYELLVATFKIKPLQTPYVFFSYKEEFKYVFQGTPTADKLYQFITNPSGERYNINDDLTKTKQQRQEEKEKEKEKQRQREIEKEKERQQEKEKEKDELQEL